MVDRRDIEIGHQNGADTEADPKRESGVVVERRGLVLRSHPAVDQGMLGDDLGS